MITLYTQTIINAPRERCFDLARSVDVHTLTARSIDGKAVAGRVSGLAEQGEWTTWSARFFGVRFRLTTQIGVYRVSERLFGHPALRDYLRTSATFTRLRTSAAGRRA